jgi:hypothetical protein
MNKFMYPKQSLQEAAGEVQDAEQSLKEIRAHPAEIPDAPKLSQQQQVDLLTSRLAKEGWRLVKMRNGEPIYDQTSWAPAEVDNWPLRRQGSFVLKAYSIQLTEEDIHSWSVYLGMVEGSVLAITAPRGMIKSTSPVGELHRVPSGDQWTIPANGYTRTVDMELVSPLARHAPLNKLTDMSFAGGAQLFLLTVWSFGVGIFKDRASKALEPTFDRLVRRLGFRKKVQDSTANGSKGQAAKPPRDSDSGSEGQVEKPGQSNIEKDLASGNLD